MKKKINSNGSATIEAAIFLPIFIIAILTLSFMMKLFYVQESFQHVLADEVTQSAMEAYCPGNINLVNIVGHKGNENTLEVDILKRFPESILKTMHIYQKPQLKHYKYMFNGRFEEVSNIHHEPYFLDTEDLIEAIVVCKVKIPFSIKFIEDFCLAQRVIARAWTGTHEILNPMPFEEMTKKSIQVHVFPRAGKKYHRKNCGIITNYPTMKILNNDIKVKFLPCKLCNAKLLGNGAYIYIFEESGEVYHSKDCNLVDKYIIALDLKEAIRKGYSPCKKCKPPILDD